VSIALYLSQTIDLVLQCLSGKGQGSFHIFELFLGGYEFYYTDSLV